ncbi:MAG: hypothetical protein ABIN67_07710 [Ferruginibacter sp.]
MYNIGGRENDRKAPQDLQMKRVDAGFVAYISISAIIIIIMLLNLLV